MAAAPPAAGEPRGGDHVEGDNRSDDVSILRLLNGEIEGAGSKYQDRNGEDISRSPVQTAAFADAHGERAGKQANRSSKDVQN